MLVPAMIDCMGCPLDGMIVLAEASLDPYTGDVVFELTTTVRLMYSLPSSYPAGKKERDGPFRMGIKIRHTRHCQHRTLSTALPAPVPLGKEGDGPKFHDAILDWNDARDKENAFNEWLICPNRAGNWGWAVVYIPNAELTLYKNEWHLTGISGLRSSRRRRLFARGPA